MAYEAGYRIRPMERVFVTVAAFYNVLHDTLSTDLLTPFVESAPPPARLILPVEFANGLHGNSYGAELTGDCARSRWWRLTANYSYLTVAMTKDPGGRDVSQERRYEGLSRTISSSRVVDRRPPLVGRLDVPLVSALPAGPIPRIPPRTSGSAGGRAARGPRRRRPGLFTTIMWSGRLGIERSVYARLTWRPSRIAAQCTATLLRSSRSLSLAALTGGRARLPPRHAQLKLKAAFVSKFPQFVEWPAAALDEAGPWTSAWSAGSLRRRPRELVAGEMLDGRPLVAATWSVSRMSTAAPSCSCPAAAGRRPLSRAAALPVLTVGDDPHFLDDGGIVRLRIIDGRVRFDINAAAAGKWAFGSARS